MKKSKFGIVFLSAVLLSSCGYVPFNSSSITSNSSNLNGESSNSISEDNSDDELMETLNIVEVNDLHGYAYRSKNGDISLSNVSGYINSLRNKNDDNVLLIGNGDMFQGTAFSNLSRGNSVVNVMNTMKFDAMGIGNHEFDWGLPEVLKYFDKDVTNGESSFPLVNSNIYLKQEDQRICDVSTTDNIVPYAIFDKLDIKVGLLSYIGSLENSISQNKLTNYAFDTYSLRNQVYSDSLKLRSLGCNVIVVNIHAGTSDNIENYEFNKSVASLKDDNGRYLVDAVLNGHTHYLQKGEITRSIIGMPVIQGGSSGDSLAIISLKICKTNHRVVSFETNKVDSNTLEKYSDSEVKETLDSEYAKIEDQVSKPIGTVRGNINYSKDTVLDYMNEVLKTYTSSDVSFINNGAVRSLNRFYPGSRVNYGDVFELYPFDNSLVYFKATGRNIKNYYDKEKDYQIFNIDVSSLDDDTVYKCSTIDYVYYQQFMKAYMGSYELVKDDSNICLRDLIYQDLVAQSRQYSDSVYLNKEKVKISPSNFPN